MKSLALRAFRLCSAGVFFTFPAGCAGGSSPSPAVPAAAPQVRALASSQTPPKLYIANSSGGVLVYTTGSNPTLVQTISNGVPKPGGIWVDRNGILYAVNLPGNSPQTSLPEYKPGANSPFRTITSGIDNCAYVAVDDHGNLYVTGVNSGSGSFFLEIYPKGRLSASQVLTIPHSGIARVTGLAFDRSGALLVGETIYLQPGVVYRLAPGSQSFTNLGLQNAPGGTIAVDKAGNIYAGSGTSAGQQAIAVYPPNATSPARVIQVQNVLDALTVARSGELYVETSGNGQPQISTYTPGGSNPSQTFVVNAGGTGLALSR